MYKLCFSNASVISIGMLGVELNLVSSSSTVDWGEVATRPLSNEYGDLLAMLEMKYSATQEFPIVKARLLHPSGETGFCDEGVIDFVNAIFKDGCLLTGDEKLILTPAVEVKDLDEAIQMLFVRGRFPTVTVFYGVTLALEECLKEYDFATLGESDYLEFLLKTAGFCEGILIWDNSYGTNPAVISRYPEALLRRLFQEFDSRKLILERVATDAQLPEW